MTASSALATTTKTGKKERKRKRIANSRDFLLNKILNEFFNKGHTFAASRHLIKHANNVG